MLNRIRNFADSIIIRIFLGFIAISFVIWGVKGVMSGANNTEIVSFTNTRAITEIDLLQEKAKEIRIIEQNSGSNLTEEEIKELNLDSVVLKRLITGRMLDYLISSYHLDISDDLLIQRIKTLDIFKNEAGNFDINIFNASLRNEHQKQEYLNNIKNNILKNTMLSIFLEGFNTPTSLVGNIITYLSESRNIDLITLELNNNNNNILILEPSDKELEEFYNKNHKIFTIPEQREITRLVIPFSTLQSKIEVNGGEIEKAVVELIKNLEDEVASGSSLIEIENRYGGKLYKERALSYAEMSKNKDLLPLAENIFNMSENEVSYPVEQTSSSEQQGQKQIILVELNKIKPKLLPKFEEIKTQIAKRLQQDVIIKTNMENLSNLAVKYKPNQLSVPELKNSLNIQIKDMTITRADIENHKLPPELLFSIFELNIGDNTKIIRSGDNIYFAHIKSVNINDSKFKEISKSKDNIATALKNGLMEELITYLIKENNTKVKQIKN